MIDLCQWRASIGLFHSRYSGCFSLKSCGAPSNRLWSLLVGLVMAFLSQLWSELKRRVRRTNIARPATSGTVPWNDVLVEILMNFFLLLPYILLNFIVVFFAVLIADLLTKKECVLLVCVMAKAPSLSMVIGRCCLLALFLAKKLLACLVLVQLLLLLSGDVETNPGPTTGELIKILYACVLCGCYYRLVR